MSRSDAIVAHYERRWGTRTQLVVPRAGPIHDLPGDYRVIVIPRSASASAFATVCMSQSEDQDPLELHLLANTDGNADDDLVVLLTAVAHYHRTGARLGLGHTVSFGLPWRPGSRCTHGLISLPYLDGPDLEWLDEPRTRFLWLIPITADELAFKKKRGLEALEEAFETAQFDYLDPARPSVV